MGHPSGESSWESRFGRQRRYRSRRESCGTGIPLQAFGNWRAKFKVERGGSGKHETGPMHLRTGRACRCRTGVWCCRPYRRNSGGAHENAHCLSAANTVVERVHSNAMPVILTTEQERERCAHRGHSKGAVAYDPLGSSAVMQTRKKATASTGTFGLSTKLRSCGLPYSGGDLMSTHLSRNGLRRCLIGAVSFLIVTMVALFGIAQHFAV